MKRLIYYIMHSHRHAASKRGFSLVEISIVLAILSIVLAGLLPIILESTRSKDIDVTTNNMERVRQALIAYSLANSGELPCPANPTTSIRDSGFGVAVGFDGSNRCDTFESPENPVSGHGMVPTRALGLADDMAFDGWGRRLTYHVSHATAHDGSAGGITVRDGSGGTRVSDAAYALVSHGPNGHGAYTIGGARFDGSSANANEQENCQCNSSAVTTGYNVNGEILVQDIATDGGATNQFDDYLIYGSVSQLTVLTSSSSSTPPVCRIQHDSSGGFSNSFSDTCDVAGEILTGFNCTPRAGVGLASVTMIGNNGVTCNHVSGTDDYVIDLTLVCCTF